VEFFKYVHLKNFYLSTNFNLEHSKILQNECDNATENLSFDWNKIGFKTKLPYNLSDHVVKVSIIFSKH